MIILDKHGIFSLKEIDLDDIEYLREWKNKHRNSFFHKEVITSEQQSKWFDSYSIDPENNMFVVMLANKAVGCMGYRMKDDIIDVYNIMRGVDTNDENFKMSDAFKLMLNYIHYKYHKKITCVVLNDNPAFQWYIKTDFLVRYEYKEHSFLEYHPKKFLNNFIVKEDA